MNLSWKKKTIRGCNYLSWLLSQKSVCLSSQCKGGHLLWKTIPAAAGAQEPRCGGASPLCRPTGSEGWRGIQHAQALSFIEWLSTKQRLLGIALYKHFWEQVSKNSLPMVGRVSCTDISFEWLHLQIYLLMQWLGNWFPLFRQALSCRLHIRTTWGALESPRTHPDLFHQNVRGGR